MAQPTNDNADNMSECRAGKAQLFRPVGARMDARLRLAHDICRGGKTDHVLTKAESHILVLALAQAVLVNNRRPLTYHGADSQP